MVIAPTSVRLRVYQVGFGDCILLTIGYPDPLADGRRERHVLIDCGTRSGARGGPSMAALVALVAEHCGGPADGHLDVVVATNRRTDHVGGFGLANADAEAHWAALQPRSILRPWTDGPAGAAAVNGDRLRTSSRRFLALLDTVADRQADVVGEFGVDGRTRAGRVGQLAELNVANRAALDMLGSWVAPDPTVWLRADDEPDIETVLPGVAIRVLGPPTLEQVPAMKSYASTSSEHWLAMTTDGLIAPELKTSTADDVWAARDEVAAPDGLGSAAWLVDKMHQGGTRQALEIVAGLDDVVDNTSLVVLVAVGDRRLLLAGDAQVENWSYVLDRALGENGRQAEPDLRDALASVDLYKVGHHGSRDGTPRRLVDLWRSERRGRKLCSVLSTKHGVLDETIEGTVPKRELVDALTTLGPVHSTAALPEGVWWFDLEARAEGKAARWTHTEGPVRKRPSPDAGDDDDDEADEDEHGV